MNLDFQREAQEDPRSVGEIIGHKERHNGEVLLSEWRETSIEGFQFEVDERGEETGWIRCTDGRLSDGRWPEWNERTGEERLGGVQCHGRS